MKFHGHATVDPSAPRAWGCCDRCGFIYQHSSLRWQHEWAGAALYNKRLLVCEKCYDKPQEQLRLRIIPPDPMPIRDPRVDQNILIDIEESYGFPPIFGVLAAIEGPDAIATYGEVGRFATLAADESSDTASMVGEVAISGALSTTDIRDRLTAAGGIYAVSPGFGAFDSPDICSIAGDVLAASAPITLVDISDTMAASGRVLVSGTMAAVDGVRDIMTGAAIAMIPGALFVVEGYDTASIAGDVSASLFTILDESGVALTDEMGNPLLMEDVFGVVGVTGVVSTSETSRDTVSVSGATGALPLTGVMATAESANEEILVIAGVVDFGGIAAALRVNDQMDVLASAGQVAVSGTMQPQDAADVMAAAGGVVGAAVVGQLTASDARDSMTIWGMGGNVTFITDEVNNLLTDEINELLTLSTVGPITLQVFGYLSPIETLIDMATSSGGSQPVISGIVSLNDRRDTFAASGIPGVIGSLSALESLVDVYSGLGSVQAADSTFFAVMDKSDVSAISGNVAVSGSMATIDDVDTSCVFAEVPGIGVFAATETGDTAEIFGGIPAIGGAVGSSPIASSPVGGLSSIPTQKQAAAVTFNEPVVIVDNAGNTNQQPGIIKLPNGSLYCVYNKGSGPAANDGYIASQYSTDNGATWSGPIAVYGQGLNKGIRDSEVALIDGTVYLNGFSYPVGGAGTYSFVLKGTISGNTVTYGSAITVNAGVSQTATYTGDNKIIKAPDGSLLMGGYTWGNNTSYGSSIVMRSTNQGTTWSLLHTFGVGDASNTWTETGGVVYPDGTILFFIRKDLGTTGYYMSKSTDSGATWTTPALIIQCNPVGKPMPIVALNGSMLFFMARGSQNKSFYAYSYDKGVTWSAWTAYPDDQTNGQYYNSACLLDQATAAIAMCFWIVASNTYVIRYQSASLNLGGGAGGGGGGGGGGSITITDGLVGYWPLNGDATDNSGNGDNGVAAFVSYSAGLINNTAVFTGSPSKVTIADAAILKPAAISVSLWINASGLADYAAPIAHVSTTSWVDGFGVYIMANGKVNFFINNWSTGVVTSTGTPFISNGWHHIVGTYDGVNVYLYVDNIEMTPLSYTTAINYVNGVSTMIGNQAPGSAIFTGDIEEVRIYSRAITPSDVTAIYAAGLAGGT